MMKKIKKILIRIYDLPNAFRVLDIMDNCGCDIEKVQNLNGDYWKIKPKWYVTEKEATDLQKIVLFKEDFYKRKRFWKKLIFRNVRDNYRPM